MAYKLIKKIILASKYPLKCPHTMAPTRIVVHNTANDASARNEIAYMTSNGTPVGFHYAVDDKEVVQGILESRNSWNAGDGNGKGNRQGIAIEICYSKSGGKKFKSAEANAVKFIATILKRKKWGIDKVTKHQDYNKKYCPHRTLDLGWKRFIKLIEKELVEDMYKNKSAKEWYDWGITQQKYFQTRKAQAEKALAEIVKLTAELSIRPTEKQLAQALERTAKAEEALKKAIADDEQEKQPKVWFSKLIDWLKKKG